MIPRMNVPQLNITPVAAPADPGVRFGAPPPVVPDKIWGELAQALSHINPALQGFVQQAALREQHDASLMGQKAALTNQGIDAYSGDKTFSPAFRASYLQAKGRLAGQAYLQELHQHYESWGEKSHLNLVHNPATGNKDLDHSHFLDFVGQFREGYLHDKTDPDWLAGFTPMMSMGEMSLLNHHTAYLTKTMHQDRLNTLAQEVLGVLDTSIGTSLPGTDNTSVAAPLKALKVEAVSSGLDPFEAQEKIDHAILLKAVEVGGFEGKNLLNLIGTNTETSSGTSVGTSPLEMRQKVAAAREQIDMQAYRAEERAWHKIQQNQRVYFETLKSNIVAKLIENPAYIPGMAEEQEALKHGFYDLPAFVEQQRKSVSDYSVDHNPRQKERFYADLYAGRLGEDDILETTSITPEEKIAALKEHQHLQATILNDPIIKSGEKQVRANLTVTSPLQRMTNSLSEKDQQFLALEEEAVGAYYTLIRELSLQDPDFATRGGTTRGGTTRSGKTDPEVFHKTIQRAVQDINQAFVPRKAALQDEPERPDQSTSPTAPDVEGVIQSLQQFGGFKSKADVSQAIVDHSQGRGKIVDYFAQHNITLTSEQLNQVLRSLRDMHSEN